MHLVTVERLELVTARDVNIDAEGEKEVRVFSWIRGRLTSAL